jgi:hypothetical protein
MRFPLFAALLLLPLRGEAQAPGPPQPPPATSQTRPASETPGITRVGRARAARTWERLLSFPGVKRESCEGDLCTVMFEPVVWAQMDLDSKREVTRMLGIALAYGRQARWTEVRDLTTNKKLATYSTRSDKAEVPWSFRRP